ncbi:MAG: SH3 domain-containing protein [Synergistaceae bacterium]|jgi:hypothetical protein|nr:SH3 domain-containing protein [Synergistaceae bacterium]
METKNTKQRLDDLQDLLQAGYLTDNEFRVARINTLKESGVDIVIHGSRKAEAKHEEEEEKPKGCGCFLTGLFLVILGIGALFFLSVWPDSLGGSYVRGVREWMSAQWSDFFSDAPSAPIPDPVGQSAGRKNVPLPAIVVIVSDDKRASPVSSSDVPSLSKDAPPSVSSSTTSSAPPSPASSPDAGADRSVIPDKAVIPAANEPDSAPAPGSVSEAQTSLVSGAPAVSPLTDGVSLPSLDARIFSLPAIEISEMSVSESPVSESLSEGPRVSILEAAPARAAKSAETRNAETGRPLRRGVVSARSARIRTTPDTTRKDNVVGWGTKGDRFTVLEEGFGKDGARWYRIRYEEGDKRGWISGSLVTVE